MRPWPLLALLLVAPSASAAETVGWPAWAPGDEWAYYVAFETPTAFPNQSALVGKRVVVARETIDIDGRAVEALRIVELNIGVDPKKPVSDWIGRDFDFEGGAVVEWVSPENGDVLRTVRLRTTSRGDVAPTTPVRTYPDGCDTIGWPLVPGANETRECRVTSDDGRAATLRPSTRVLGEERASVPAGEFTALVTDVATEGELAERQWYSSEACWRVKAQGPAPARASMQLLGYRCGERAGGQLNRAVPQLDLDRLTVQPRESPAPALPIALGLLAALAWMRRR